MLVYLDSVICIYAVEGAPSFQMRARARLATIAAAAVENGCGLFLTNDQRLAGFRDIPVEVLP
jgi:hypothetical protein